MEILTLTPRPDLTPEALRSRVQERFGNDYDVRLKGDKVVIDGGFSKGAVAKVKQSTDGIDTVLKLSPNMSSAAMTIFVVLILLFIPAGFLFRAAMFSSSRGLVGELRAFLASAYDAVDGPGMAVGPIGPMIR